MLVADLQHDRIDGGVGEAVLRVFRVPPGQVQRGPAWGSWIRQWAVNTGTHPVMIGAILPPEVALGLGIDAAQLTEPGWPGHLWPIVPKPPSNDLVVPHLNLGAEAYFHPLP
jgi:hypothetical protein